MVRAAAGDAEIWRVVLLRGKLDDSASGDFVVAAASPIRRKNYIRIPYAAVRVLLSIDDVKIPGARRLDADAHPISFADRRTGFDSLGRPLGILCRFLLEDPRAAAVRGLRSTQPPQSHAENCFGWRRSLSQCRS